jgi:enamine deaminase RidA (YjgF/YER057c/UK114 family)
MVRGSLSNRRDATGLTSGGRNLKREFLNPESMATPRGYTHAVTVEDAKKIVFVAGQVALATDGSVVGVGDVEAQARQAFENVKNALEAAGASVSDVVRLTTYVVDYRPEHRDVLHRIRQLYWAEGNLPTSTLLGVQALALPEFLVEVEVTAVVGDPG